MRRLPGFLWIICAGSAVSAAGIGRSAFADTWIGPGTDWNTAANWSPAAVPNSFTDDVLFGDTGVGTVNISSGVVARSITFTNSTGNYTLTSNAAQGLGITSITMASNVAGSDQISLATSTTDSLQAPFFSNITVTNNSLAGGRISIGGATVIGTFGGAGSIIFQGPGDSTLDATFASTPAAQVNGLTKNGPGSLDYKGDGSALGGATTLNGGTLILDFANSTSPKSSSGAPLVLNNGILQLISNGSVAVTQPYTGGTTFNAGHTDIAASGNQNITLNLAGITRSVAGTTDFTSSGSIFFLPTTAGNTNGLLGTGTAFATISGGTTWATASGGQIIPFTAYSNNIVGSGVNSDLTGGQFIGLIVNSIRFSTANDSFNLLSPGILQSGGVLIAPTATNAAITGDTLTASNGEFVFHVYSTSGFFVNSSLIASNGLTKTGPGPLFLAGNNTSLTGPININRGGLTITNIASVNSASAIHFNDDRAGANLQQFTISLGNSISGTLSTPISLSAFSPTDYGTYFSTTLSQSSTITLSGPITSALGLTTPIRFSAETNSGFNLTNPANSFTGNISIQFGTLGISSDGALGNPTNTLVLETVNAATGGLIFLNSGINVAHPVALSGIPHFTSNGADSNTISGLISGAASAVIKNGTGTLILANPSNSFTGNISVNSGTLSLGATGGFTAAHNLTVNAGATFSPGTANTSPAFSSITLNGGTFRAAAGSISIVTSQLVIQPAGGTLDFTGSASFDFIFLGSSPSITVNANATWLSPNNGSVLANGSSNNISIVIPSGVILTNGIALFDTFFGAPGFTLTGGGVLFQNSDATNQINLVAPITVSQGTYRVTDISTSGHGNLGFGTFTLNGGTLSYGGASATTTHPLALTANGGSIQVELAATALTINARITGPGTLTKTGIGTLILPVANSYNATTLSLGTLLVTNTSGSATGLGNVTLNGGTLGGSGFILGNVIPGTAPHTIFPSATLPANATTTLFPLSLTTNLFTTLAFNLKTPAIPGGSDQIQTNTLTLNAGTLQINNTSTGKTSLGYYQAIAYNGSIQGAGINSITLPPITNNISYILDTLHDPGFVDIHRGFLGDANDDGTVDLKDLQILALHWQQGGANWSSADFDNSGFVDLVDLQTLALHWQATIGPPGGSGSGQSFADALSQLSQFTSIATPEPASLMLLTPLLLLSRRRGR